VLASLGGLTGCDTSEPSDSARAKGKLGSNAREPTAPDWVAEFESQSGAWRLRYRPEPDPIPRNALFELDVELVSADPNIAISAVDARMPDHQHGMTLKPKLLALGAGRYRVEGLLFHMSGFWELFFWVEGGANPQRVRFEVELE
jgi:hypothetical protein